MRCSATQRAPKFIQTEDKRHAHHVFSGDDVFVIYRDAQAGGAARARYWREEYALNAGITITRFLKP